MKNYKIVKILSHDNFVLILDNLNIVDFINNYSNYTIHTICRKSDSKIFSIEDKFKWFLKETIKEDPECGTYNKTFKGIIKEFKIIAGQLNIMHLHKFSIKYKSKIIKDSNLLSLNIKYLV